MRGAELREYSVYFKVWRHSRRRWIGREAGSKPLGQSTGHARSWKVAVILTTLALTAHFVARGVTQLAMAELLPLVPVPSASVSAEAPLPDASLPEAHAVMAHETLDRPAPPSSTAGPEAALPRTRARRARSPEQQPQHSEITRTGATSFRLPRSLVDRALQNRTPLIGNVGAVIHEENGRVVGPRIYGIRENSLLAELGLRNGDLLRAINGFDLTTADSALDAYAKLRTASHLTLSLVRGGQPLTLHYVIER
jgi:hypothetical protein